MSCLISANRKRDLFDIICEPNQRHSDPTSTSTTTRITTSTSAKTTTLTTKTTTRQSDVTSSYIPGNTTEQIYGERDSTDKDDARKCLWCKLDCICQRGNIEYKYMYPNEIVVIQTGNIGAEPDPRVLATGTKLGEQFSWLYFDRCMSID